MVRQPVHNFTFAFVAPLGANYNYISSHDLSKSS
jgi:hypothetical protein